MKSNRSKIGMILEINSRDIRTTTILHYLAKKAITLLEATNINQIMNIEIVGVLLVRKLATSKMGLDLSKPGKEKCRVLWIGMFSSIVQANKRYSIMMIE